MGVLRDVSLNIGDYVTIERWVDSDSKSYTDSVLEVTAMEGKLVLLVDVQCSNHNPIIRRGSCILKKISSEFVQAIKDSV